MRLSHPSAAAHRGAGYRDQLAILQAEFALTHVLDRRVTRRTPPQSRTRVLTEGVTPGGE